MSEAEETQEGKGKLLSHMEACVLDMDAMLAGVAFALGPKTNRRLEEACSYLEQILRKYYKKE